ncbi:MAG: hypothetical protein V1644_03160 [Candidatus Micrarchaeota archaeon]
MKKLTEFIHSELQQGKTIGQIKKDIKQSHSGWSSKEISKAITAATHKELKQRQPPEQRLKEEKQTTNSNKIWMWAIAIAVIAVVIITAAVLYFM